MARYIALTCEALARSIYALAAASPHTVTVRLYRQGLHNSPKNLRGILQTQIDEIAPGECDAILLAYGLCGGSTEMLTARHTPVVIPRAHDCITLYLGSRERYQEEFTRHPGTYWYSLDYMERQEAGNSSSLGAAGISDTPAEYDTWVQKWGQETADALVEEMRGWTQHYSRAAFIDTGLGDGEPFAQKARDKAAKEGWVYEEMQGNRRLLAMLVRGDWESEEILVVPPGHTIRQTHKDSVIHAVPQA
jgi:hypothetical protein